MATEKPHDQDHLVSPAPEGLADPGAHDLAESSADESEDHFSDAQSDLASPVPRLHLTSEADDETKSQSDNSSIKTALPTTVGDAQDTETETDDTSKDDDTETKTELSSKPDDQDDDVNEKKQDEDATSANMEDVILEADVKESPEANEVQERMSEVSVDDDKEDGQKSPLPGGFPVPITILAEAPGSVPLRLPHVEHTHATDTSPDVVVKPEDENSQEATEFPREQSTVQVSVEEQSIASPSLEPPKSPSLSTPSSPRVRRKSSRHLHSPVNSLDPPNGDDDFDDFGDFDDFEGGDGDSFGDFDDTSFQTPIPAPVAAVKPPPSPAIPVTPLLPFPVPDFEGVDEEDIPDQMESYINMLFPPETLDVPELPPLSKENTHFLTTRSASLWSQLVAPPSLAPPDWIRCRIRHLFLVSLGVPIDLDEILPASKQKKLILPSISIPSGKSPRTSTDSRSKKNGETGDGSSRRRKDEPPPTIDLLSAKQLCEITVEACHGMTEEELKAHTKKLRALQVSTNDAIVCWRRAKEEKEKEKEALEAVIGDLVKHAQKVRK